MLVHSTMNLRKCIISWRCATNFTIFDRCLNVRIMYILLYCILYKINYLFACMFTSSSGLQTSVISYNSHRVNISGSIIPKQMRSTAKLFHRHYSHSGPIRPVNHVFKNINAKCMWNVQHSMSHNRSANCQIFLHTKMSLFCSSRLRSAFRQMLSILGIPLTYFWGILVIFALLIDYLSVPSYRIVSIRSILGSAQ